MIIKTRYAGEREVRDAFSGINTSPQRWAAGGLTSTGQYVTNDVAVGLPALGAAVRFVAGMVASLRMSCWQGYRGDKREQEDAWQAQLLAQPWDGSTFDWLWDVVASLETTENAVLRKVRSKGRVVALLPVPLDKVRIYRERATGTKIIEVAGVKGTTAEYLHVRGQTLGNGLVGVSRIWQHRDPVGAQLAAMRFEGKFFQNDARPGVAFVFPDNVRRDQASEWKTDIEQEYGGVDNAWKPFVAGGGVTITPIPVNLQDAQFIEGRRLGVDDIGRIMDVDPIVLGSMLGTRGEREEGLQRFLAVQLPPRLARIAGALKADPDLFGSTPLYPGFDLNDLTFVDPVRRAAIIHEKIQDGTLLPDEARAEEGRGPLPPIPDDPSKTPGMVPQMTPVGGAPNPQAAAAPAPPPEPPEPAGAV